MGHGGTCQNVAEGNGTLEEMMAYVAFVTSPVTSPPC
jgi:hypothetical protein